MVLYNPTACLVWISARQEIQGTLLGIDNREVVGADCKHRGVQCTLQILVICLKAEAPILLK